MRGNRGVDTRPEVALRAELQRRGRRFRKNYAPDPGVRCRGDVVFLRERVIVFCDGCFWHRCPDHGTAPRTHSAYWSNKLDRNVARDRRNDAEFAARGWLVIRVWEHEDPADAAERIGAVLDAARLQAAAAS